MHQTDLAKITFLNIDLLKIPAKLTIIPHNKHAPQQKRTYWLYRTAPRDGKGGSAWTRQGQEAGSFAKGGGRRQEGTIIDLDVLWHVHDDVNSSSNRCNKFSIFIFRSVWLAVCFMCAHVHRLVCILLHCDCIAYIYPPLTNHTQINRDEQNKYELHIVSWIILIHSLE